MTDPHSDALFSELAATLHERVLEIISPSVAEDCSRDLLSLSSNISAEDVEVHEKVISRLIDVEQSQLFKPKIITKIMQRLDAAHDFKLSAEELAKARYNWARYEGDKVRLLYSYFRSLLKRSSRSKSVIITMLKMKYLEKHGATAEEGHTDDGDNGKQLMAYGPSNTQLEKVPLDDHFGSDSESDEPPAKPQPLPLLDHGSSTQLPDTLQSPSGTDRPASSHEQPAREVSQWADQHEFPAPPRSWLEGTPSVRAPEVLDSNCAGAPENRALDVLTDDSSPSPDDVEVISDGGDDDASGDDVDENAVSHLNLAPKPVYLDMQISSAEDACRDDVADTIGHHKKHIAAALPTPDVSPAKRVKRKQAEPTPEVTEQTVPARVKEFNKVVAHRIAGIGAVSKLAGICTLSKLEFPDAEQVSIKLQQLLSVLQGLKEGNFEKAFTKIMLKRERCKFIFQLRNMEGKVMAQTTAPVDQPDDVEQAFQTATVLVWVASAGGCKDTLRRAKTLITTDPAD